MKKYLLQLFIFFFCFSCKSQNYVLSGMTYYGGASGSGAIFNYGIGKGLQAGGNNLLGFPSGANPFGGLVPDSSRGVFYAMTSLGGIYNEGTISAYTVCSGWQNIISFQNNTLPDYPYGNLVYDSAKGLFYGMTSAGGTSNSGTIFSLDPVTNSYSSLVSFHGPDGANPHGSLTLNPDNGLYYGMTSRGGTLNYGVIFSFNPNTNQDTVVYSLSSGSISTPYGNLTWDPAEHGFGIMTYGPGTSWGNLGYFNPTNNTYSEYTSFRCIWGGYPYGSLTYDPVNSRLYGMTTEIPCGNYGNVFWYVPSPANWGSVSTMNSTTTGEYPYGSLTYDPDNGLFYGTARSGGLHDSGTMFSINPVTDSEKVLINFSKSAGALPYNDLMYDPANNLLYGMTYAGGSNNEGVIYSYNISANSETVLLNFAGANGAYPWGDLTYLPSTGMLYGMTLDGGSFNSGIFFKFDTTTNTETVIHTFGGHDSNGCNPYGNLTFNPADNLYYGLTSGGGINSHGTLFSYNPSSGDCKYILHFDSATYPMGETPYGSLTTDSSSGLFYGMTNSGGTGAAGVLFSYNPSTEIDSTLVNFNGTNGSSPIYSQLIHDPSNGLYYGMTEKGGTGNYGVIFSYNPIGNIQTVIFNFDSIHGKYPYGSLSYNPVNGMLYGMTYSGGNGNHGVVFSFNVNTNAENVVLNFNNTNGANPEGSLLYDKYDGNLYGLTTKGGIYNYGVLFCYAPITGNDSVLVNFNDTIGANPAGNLCLINSASLRVTLFGNTSIVCPLNSTTITASGGNNASYLWSTSSTSSGITVSPSTTTTYSVFVCDGIYSKDTSITVTIYPLLNFNQLHNVSCCGDSDGSATAIADSGKAPFTYSWSTNPVQTNAQATGLKAGTYTVVVQDSNTCTAGATVIIIQPSCLHDSIKSMCATCCDCRGIASIYVWGGTPPYSYSWSNVGTTDSIVHISSGSYTSVVTDNNGCVLTDTVFVHKGSDVSASESSVSCAGLSDGSVTVAVGGNYSYSWSPNGGTEATATGLSAGAYTVTLSNLDTASCVSSYVIIITQPPVINLTVVASGATCSGQSNGSASANVNGGTPGYNYSWLPGGGTGPTASGLSAGTYTVTVTDANGCRTSATVSISQPNSLSVSIPYISPSCGGTYSANTTVTGGTPPFTYNWAPPAGNVSSLNLFLMCPTEQNPLYLSLTVTDANGCSAMASQNFYVPLNFTFPSGQITDVKCFGDNSGSITVNICGGAPPFSYMIRPGSNYISYSSTYTFYGLAAGTYSVSVGDGLCTTYTSTYTITQPGAMSIIPHSLLDNGSCNGVAWVEVSGGVAPYTYSWTGGAATDSIINQCSGVYCCMVTDSNNCSDSVCINITSVTGIKNSNNPVSVTIYPNPNKGNFTVELSNSVEKYYMQIYNMLGETIAVSSLNSTVTNIDMSTRAAGVYLYRVIDKVGKPVGNGMLVIDR